MLRTSAPGLITLTVLAIVFGIWPIIGNLTTVVPGLAVPAAAGLPFGIPPLRSGPMGDATWGFWVAQTLAALVMLTVAALRMVNSHNRHPVAGAGRRFAGALGATVLGVVAGNLVLGVFQSFVTHSDLPTYLGYLLANVLVSALFGLLLGLVVGAVAAAVPGRRAGSDRPSKSNRGPLTPLGDHRPLPGAPSPLTGYR